ncbi:MAG: FtsH protease activity modulator HflK, partial [Thiohalophilus sp.]
IAAEAWERIQDILDSYQTGLQVRGFNMQKAQPPKEVMAAFDDVAAAREDRENFINQAKAYANDILPRAEGQAQRMLEEAKAYKEQIVSVAEGETDRFLNVLSEYRKAPQVMRQRLYLETMEEVLANNSKVLVDIKDGNNIMYLPLDQIMKNVKPSSRDSNQQYRGSSSPTSQKLPDFGQDPSRDRSRSREER